MIKGQRQFPREPDPERYKQTYKNGLPIYPSYDMLYPGVPMASYEIPAEVHILSSRGATFYLRIPSCPEDANLIRHIFKQTKEKYTQELKINNVEVGIANYEYSDPNSTPKPVQTANPSYTGFTEISVTYYNKNQVNTVESLAEMLSRELQYETPVRFLIAAMRRDDVVKAAKATLKAEKEDDDQFPGAEQ